jgi:FtsH-binding integral membrane protein
MIATFCCLRQLRAPWNLVLLTVFTLSFAYILSQLTTIYADRYGGPLVLQAVIYTAIIVLALTFYTFIARIDFSTLVGILIVVVVCFIMFGISCIFTWNPVLYTLYCTLGVIVAGILLIIDTQTIVDGDRGIGLDDYVLGALILYIDIMRLFLWILRALGSRK